MNADKTIIGFKSLFTDNAKKSIFRQMKHKNIFADVMHDLANSANVKNLLKKIKQKTGADIDLEAKAIENNVKFINEQYPILKVSDFDIDDKGIKLEVETNPYFRNLNKECEQIYDFIINSTLDGFYNGFSINFNPTKVSKQDGIDVIDDVDIYGISLVSNSGLGEDSGVMEVAVRSIQNFKTMEMRSMENTKGNEKIVVKKDESEKKIEALQEEVAELKKGKEEEEKAKEIENKVEEERRKAAEEKEKLQKELEDKEAEIAKVKEKMGANKQQSVVNAEDKYRQEHGRGPIETIKEEAKNLSIGEALHLQGEFQTNNALPDETRKAMISNPSRLGIEDEIRIKKNI